MATLVVPSLDEDPWPTLGPQVCDFIEDHLCFGPGPLKGKPYVIEPEFRAQIHRAYEVFPKGHARAGWRRFKRVAVSMRKGTAKTEKGSVIAIVESHPDAPVRSDGFDSSGEPVGRGVADPYIPLLAYSKEQTEDLGFQVVKTILEECDLGGDYDVGEEAIYVLDDRGRRAGEIKALAGSPSARDGARTTFQHFDETHRLYLPTAVAAHSTMLENTYKRRDADPWSLETTTAPASGQGSIAEKTQDYAELIAAGKVDDPRLFFFHRHATPRDLDTRDDVREYLLEASGPSAEWSADIEGLVDHYFEPDCDRIYFRRVWGNERIAGGGKAFDIDRWNRDLANPTFTPSSKDLVVAGFDGARRRDATALIATHVETCHQWPIGIWERPDNAPDDWEIDESEVTAALAGLFERHKVWRLYCDPHHWGPTIDAWSGRWGDRVYSYDTRSWTRIGYACRNYLELQQAGTLTHNGDPTFAWHIGNAYRHDLNIVDEDTGEPLWTLRKERRDSPLKIDAAMAAVLSAEARNDAIAAGALKKRSGRAAGF